MSVKSTSSHKCEVVQSTEGGIFRPSVVLIGRVLNEEQKVDDAL